MSIIKSFSVGDGDTYYIRHGSDNFTIIDCNIDENNQEEIIDEIKKESKGKNIHRFISTHPDEDHIHGLEILDENWKILNFYCVKNEATKEDETDSFAKYCELRDDKEKAYYIYKGCKRRWMNLDSEDGSEEYRGSSGLSVLWPDMDNEFVLDALQQAKDGGSPNNISPIIVYRAGLKFMWMGDIESDYLENVQDEIDFEEIDVLFAPHHGRESGKISSEILEQLNPQIIVIGEAPSKNLHYYNDYNIITQNSAKDIIFDIHNGTADIYVGNENYSVDYLEDKGKTKYENYIGTISKR